MAEDTIGKLVKGSLWLTVAGLIINLLQTLSTIIVAYFLTPEDFGLVAIALTFLAIVTALTNMQLGEALIRQKDPGEQQISAVWTLNLIRGLVMAAIFAAAAWPTAQFYSDDRLVPILLVLSLSPILLGMENPKRFIQQRDLVFRQEFLITVLQKVAGFTVTVGIAAIWHSYWALIIGNIFLNGTGTLISFVLIRYQPRITFRGIREIFGFSLWITLGQIVNTLNWRFEYLLIGKVLGMSPLGIYNMGSQLAQIPTAETVKPLKKVIYPGFTRVLNDPNSTPARLRAAYQRAQGVVTLIALPVGVGFAVLADPLISLALSERWHPVIPIVQYLSVVFAFQTLGSLVQPLGWAKNRTRWLFVRDCWMFCIRMPLIIGGMLLWGLPGVVLGRVVSGSIATCFNMFLVKRLIDLPVRRQLAANWRSVVSVIVSSGVVVLISSRFSPETATSAALTVQILLEAGLGLGLYVGMNILLWLLSGIPEGPETEIRRIIGKALRHRRAPPTTDTP